MNAIGRTLAVSALLAALPWPRNSMTWAEETPAAPVSLREETRQNASAPCIEPVPTMRWEDYQGKFRNVVDTFARNLERSSAHTPHYKAGAVLCTGPTKDKLIFFVQDTFNPLTFLEAGFNAGISHAEKDDRAFGQGGEGYAKRFGARFAGQVSSKFFKDFAYPTIFSEDPRYYRLARGSGRARFLHAVEHAFVAHREDGTRMFNFSEWLGTTSGVALSNLYHPGNEPGIGPAARRVGYCVLGDIGSDLLREFWPEIARKFSLPFRARR